MRISDWSSDVCSSDLEQHRRDIVAHQAAPKRDLLLGIGGQACRPLIKLMAHFKHFGNLTHTRLDPGFGDFAIAQRKAQILAYRHGVVNNGKLEYLSDIARLGRSRSEEHTSELKSLMRISYAVFCLKKQILT